MPTAWPPSRPPRCSHRRLLHLRRRRRYEDPGEIVYALWTPPLPPVGWSASQPTDRPTDRPAIANKVARGRKARYCRHLPSRFRAPWSPLPPSSPPTLSLYFSLTLHSSSACVLFRRASFTPPRPESSCTYTRVCLYLHRQAGFLFSSLRCLLSSSSPPLSGFLSVPLSFSFFYYALSEPLPSDCFHSSSSSSSGFSPAVKRDICTPVSV